MASLSSGSATLVFRIFNPNKQGIGEKSSVSDPDSLNPDPDPAKNLNPDPGKFVTPTKNFMNFFLHQIPVIR